MPKLYVLPKKVVVTTEAQAKRLLSQIKKQDWVSVDTETTSLDITEAQLLVITISWALKDAVRAYIPFQGNTLLVMKYFKPWLQDPKYRKSFTNAKYDIEVLARHGIRVRGLLYDTFILDWLLDENREGRHGLKQCAMDHLGLKMDKFEDILKRNGAKNFSEVSEADQIEYATKDPWATDALIRHRSLLWGKSMIQALREHPAATPPNPERTLLDHYEEVEIPFIQVLGRMERRGMAISRGYLRDLEPELKGKMDRLAFEFNQMGRRPINIDSPTDLAKYLYLEDNGLKLKITKWTSGGKSGNRKPSVDKSVIEKEAQREERTSKRGPFTVLGEYRKLGTLLRTFVRGLLKASDNEDRRIHSSFRMDLVTGRLSSSRPNLQNIPQAKKDKYGIRGAFIAKPTEDLDEDERVILCLDYSQLEIRVAAHYSKDKRLIDALKSGADIHARTASEMYGMDYEAIMKANKKAKKDQTSDDIALLRARDDAKVIGFGLIYGMQAYALSMNLGCSPQAAQDKINRYFATYPGVLAWIEATKTQCREVQYVQTLQGRYRRLRDICKGLIKSHGKWVSNGDREAARIRRHAENQAVNTPVQGGAADIVKMAMIKTGEAEEYGDPRLKKLECYLILQVHDELLWELPSKNAEEAQAIITPLMEHPFDFELRVPLIVAGGIAENWAEAK